MGTIPLSQPLIFLKLIAHDLRWKLIRALSWSDFRVQELVGFVGQPTNLVSYHLRRLRDQAVVRERRSSADARDVYYSLDLDRLCRLYVNAGENLHPALRNRNSARKARPKSNRPKIRVLFLCTRNSARSQMAEAILRHLSEGQVECFSAGTFPSQIHPQAIATMRRHGMDITQQRSKHLDEFQGQAFDYIITLCDQARERCPSFPGDPQQLHWSFPDPAAVESGESTETPAFEATARGLMTRIQYWMLALAGDPQESM